MFFTRIVNNLYKKLTYRSIYDKICAYRRLIMRKFLVEIQFNGKNYNGFQSVNNGVTIEQKLCEAIQKVFNQNAQINGCSRTDAGVSAESYYFDFGFVTKLSTDRVPFKLNRYLPKDVQTQSATEVPLDFHARYNAVSKTYEYGFYLSKHVQPLLNPKNYKISDTANLEKMIDACKLFIGKHDFSAFKTPSKDKILPIRTIFDCKLINDGNRLVLQITGDGFLYNMVRIIAGTIVKVGENELSLSEVEKLLNDGKERKDNPALTLPPNALILKSVKYKI